MDWVSALIDWLSANWSLFTGNILVFAGFGVIEAAIILLVFKFLYGARLKQLPELTKLQNELRKEQEDNVRLSEENKNLQAENLSLRDEIVMLQSDEELLKGLETAQTEETIGAKISKALDIC